MIKFTEEYEDILSYFCETVQFTEQLQRQMYSEHCQTFKIGSFAKINT